MTGIRNAYAILEKGEIVYVDHYDPRLENQFANPGKRRVAKTEFLNWWVSTVFLGLNHGYSGKDLWFETMIFGGVNNGFIKRYGTLEEARRGHKRAVWVAAGGYISKALLRLF